MSDSSTKYFSQDGVTKSTRYIHTPSEMAANNFLYVQEVGILKSLRVHRSIRENVDSYLFMCITSGEGLVVIEGKEYKAKAGDSFLIDCMKHYEHESSEEKPWELAWVHFNGKSVRALYDLFLKYNNSENKFTSEDADGYPEMIEYLMGIQNNGEALAEIYANEMLVEMMTSIIEDVKELSEVETGVDVSEVRTLINDGYAADSVLEDIVKKTGFDIENIDKAFKASYGITTEEYLAIRKFNVAKELLRFTVKPIDKIALESGMGSVNNLIKVFAENEGCTPEVYRSKWAQWIR